MKNKDKYKIKVLIYAILSAFIILCVILSDIIVPLEINASLENRFLPPGSTHFFGTDDFGRDVFLRTLQGFKYTFFIALTAQICSFLLGGFIGLITGYYGGIADEAVYYLCNLILSFPMIAAAIFFSSVFGSSALILIAISVIFGMTFNIKVVRSEIMILKHSDYIKGLKILGASNMFIITRHLVKPAYMLILPTFPLVLGHIIIGISAYSFLGFGVRPPNPEIGLMLKESLRFIHYAPWLMIFPGLFQFSVILIFSNLSETCIDFLQYTKNLRRKI
ncbi:ABC transporter permease [Treponema pedis]|uniref:ABC transporter permease n=1 Tax=Treponema pedis TaxID=409322 RepID=UPI00042A4B77|nr:ABC transporter permease [Treponema pedis]